MIDLIHLTGGEADLVAVGGITGGSGGHQLALCLLYTSGVLAQTLVELLTVAALLHGLHHDVLAGHEGQLGHQADVYKRQE